MLNNTNDLISLIALCVELRATTEAHAYARDLVASYWNDGDVNLCWFRVQVADQIRLFGEIEDIPDFQLDMDLSANAADLSECEHCSGPYQYITDHDCWGTRAECGEAAHRSEYEMDYYSGHE